MRSLKESYRFFVEGLVKQLNPKQILEIGLGSSGYTADGLLSLEGYDFKYFVIEKDPNPIALEVLSKYKKDKYELIIGDSKDPELFKYFSDGIHQNDFILIDGNHEVSYVFSDIQMCVIHNILKYNGIFILHDADSSAIRYAMDKASKEFNLEYFVIPESNIAIAKYK